MPPPRSLNDSLGIVAAIATTLFSILVPFLVPPASADYSTTGHWTPPADWHLEGTQTDNLKYAVHLVLLRGDGSPYHSRILWWRAEKQDEFARPAFLGSADNPLGIH